MPGFPSPAARALSQLPASPKHYADGGPVGFGARGLAGLRDLVPKMAAMGYPQAAASAPAPAAAPSGAERLRAMIPQVEAMGYKQASAPAPQYFAEGGVVRGPGTGTSDSIEDEVPPGTFIMPADSTQAVGMDAMQQLGAMPQDKVPVRLSDGETKIPPEQVMAFGAAVLQAMKDLTHTPVNGQDGGQTDAEMAEPAGFAPTAEQQMAAPPEQRFADGGAVGMPRARRPGAFDVDAWAAQQTQARTENTQAVEAQARAAAEQAQAEAEAQAQQYADGGLVDPARRPNSFGDAAAVASDPSVTQVRTSAADTFGRAPAPAPAAPAGFPSAAARMASTGDPTNPYAASNAAVMSNFANQQGSRGIMEMGRAPAPAPLTAPNSFGDAAAATVDPSVTQPRYTPGAPAPAVTQLASVPTMPPPAGLAASARPATPAPAAAAPAAPMGWADRQAQRNADVSAASITNRPEWSRAPAGLARRGYADGGLVTDEERRRQALVQQIPVGGQQAPAADGSQSNPLNTELGRNAMNTLAALPGAGTSARAGAAVARGAGNVATAERAIPATWELAEGGGALASRAAAPAAQQMAQLPSAGGPLARAANMAPQQAPALAGPGGQVATAGGQAGQAARGAMEFVERVPDAALGMSQAAAPAGLAARAGGGGVGRYATGAAGLGAAALLSGATGDTGAAPTQPAGFAPNALAAPAPGPAPAAAALGQMPGAAPTGMVTRDGNSYTGPANISGDITINGAGPRGGGISAQNMGAADALAGRQAQESAARVLGQMPAGFQGAAVEPPVVRHSGNSWQERNDLRNALVSASSITANGGRFDRNKGESAESLTYRAMLGNDIAARGAVPKLAGEAMAQNSETNRATLRERSLAAQGAANRENDLNRTLITERGNNTRAGIAADATTEAARARAAAAGQKPATEGERLSSGYAQRMIEATKYIDKFEESGKPGYISETARALPGIGGPASRIAMTKEQQQFRQGQEDWVRAKLRKESGAVIGDQEMQREIEAYFPMPGDEPETIQQKRAARSVAIDAMRTNAGAALPEQYRQAAQQPAGPGAPGAPADTPAQVTDAASYQALPAGAMYTTPSGEVRRKK